MNQERLIELKKAFMDLLIDRTRKEAARFSVSEMKAVRLEKELKDSKEQALQMLLRLKKMMDDKVQEADMISRNQQREIQELNGQLREAADTICKAEAISSAQNKKIELLEAQLNEAEDIVKDLREELKESHKKLERVRRSNLQSNELFGTATKFTGVHIPEENTVHTSQPIISSLFPSLFPVSCEKISSITNSSLYQRNANFGENLNERKPVIIPSILLKSKGPEFGGNRRTQRIRAFEENLIADQLSLTERTNVVNAHVDISTKEDGVGSTGDLWPVEKKVPKLSVTNQSWRQIAPCKKKKISSTREIYSRAKRVEETHSSQSGEDLSGTVNKLSDDEEDNAQLTQEREGLCDEEFTDNDSVVNNAENSLALMDDKEKDIPAVIAESMKTDDLPVTDNVLKYTFQRKRKRDSTSSSDGVLPADQSVSKRNTSEEPNFSLEMDKCNSIVESSRDNPRRALVSHELISLSDKKW